MTKISDLRKFDAAEHIGTPEAQGAFFAEAMETGDPAEIRYAVNVIARARGMATIAEAAAVPRESLYRALSDKGNPEFGTMMRVITAMGFKLTAHERTKAAA